MSRIHPHAAHDVVRRRADFHRFLRDVDVGQLLELVIHARQLAPDDLLRVRQPLLDPRDVEEDAAARTAASGLDLVHDAARDVVAGQELGWTSCVLVPLGIAPALVFVVRRLVAVRLGDRVEHEAAAFAVQKDAAFAANALGDEDALHARRPDHAGRMELDELHVHQFGARVVGERMSVAGAFPAVAGDLVCAPGAAGRHDHRSPR